MNVILAAVFSGPFGEAFVDKVSVNKWAGRSRIENNVLFVGVGNAV